MGELVVIGSRLHVVVAWHDVSFVDFIEGFKFILA